MGSLKTGGGGGRQKMGAGALLGLRTQNKWAHAWGSLRKEHVIKIMSFAYY
jgi:hypothetical protein